MSGLTVAAVVALSAAGGMAGLGLRRNLARLEYRRDGPQGDERDRPRPGSRAWVPVVLAAAWLGLGAAYADSGWPWLFLWLPYTAAGAWLAAVDLDVRRLPDKVQAALAGYVFVVGGVLIATGYANWVTGLVGCFGCVLAFGVIHLVNRRGLGFGDVKHVVIIGWCLGLADWMSVLYGLTIACFAGIGWALVRREREFAFGPWLILGTTVAAIIAGFGWTAAVSLSLA
jgi:leader peptidase (prepilin peptidase)/N-methyltransferase